MRPGRRGEKEDRAALGCRKFALSGPRALRVARAEGACLRRGDREHVLRLKLALTGGTTMALRFLERELRRLLVDRGREELAHAAVGAISFTDDGASIYVHLMPK